MESSTREGSKGETTTVWVTVAEGRGSKVVVVFFLATGFFFSCATTADGLLDLDLDFFVARVEEEEADREEAGEDLFFSAFFAVVAAEGFECLVKSFVREALVFLSIAE